uniref:Uncharacterized protein n=1 Tax=Arundo donax TaxID=35708 RepID=A0A0A9ETM0_ARUDO
MLSRSATPPTPSRGRRRWR